MSDGLGSVPVPALERPPLDATLRLGPRLVAALAVVLLAVGIGLAVAKARHHAGLAAGSEIAEGVVAEVIFKDGVGYQDLIEVPAGAGHEALRVLGAPRSVPAEFYVGSVRQVRHWPAQPERRPEILGETPEPTPLWLDLLLRGAGVIFIALVQFVLSRGALLAQEGLWLSGVITEYRREQLPERTVDYPVIRISDPPHAGRLVELKGANATSKSHPVGTTTSVLAHPDKLEFNLEPPSKDYPAIGIMLLVGLALFVAPELIAAWRS